MLPFLGFHDRAAPAFTNYRADLAVSLLASNYSQASLLAHASGGGIYVTRLINTAATSFRYYKSATDVTDTPTTVVAADFDHFGAAETPTAVVRTGYSTTVEAKAASPRTISIAVQQDMVAPTPLYIPAGEYFYIEGEVTGGAIGATIEWIEL